MQHQHNPDIFRRICTPTHKWHTELRIHRLEFFSRLRKSKLSQTEVTSDDSDLQNFVA